MEKVKFDENVRGEKPINFFGMGEGGIYVKEVIFNTKDEGKRKLLDDNGYFIENLNYIFKEFKENNELFINFKLS